MIFEWDENKNKQNKRKHGIAFENVLQNMKTMTLDEVKNLPPLTEQQMNEIKNFQNTDFSDCPRQTKEDLKQFRSYYEIRAELRKRRKETVQIGIDSDIIEALHIDVKNINPV